ncbi:MAG: cytochrome c [Saprospiraceae bacterium]|nr:cytochrome c [Saprospiraceae bacterium]
MWFIVLLGCSPSFEQGKLLYESRCANCHMSDGSGLGMAIPPLSADKIVALDLEIACLIRTGVDANSLIPMPAQKDLTETEITNILNYLRSEFTDIKSFYKPTDVAETLIDCN